MYRDEKLQQHHFWILVSKVISSPRKKLKPKVPRRQGTPSQWKNCLIIVENIASTSECSCCIRPIYSESLDSSLSWKKVEINTDFGFIQKCKVFHSFPVPGQAVSNYTSSVIYVIKDVSN